MPTAHSSLTLIPFCGLRYARPTASVTSPPYDLVDDETVIRLMAADRHNVVGLIRPRGGVRDRYAHAAALLRGWLADGTLTYDPEPALYVYEDRGEHGVQRGIVGGVGLSPDAVLPHEDVYPPVVADRLALMEATAANLEPILLMYAGAGSDTTRLVDEVASSGPPAIETTLADGTAYRLWPVTDPHAHATVVSDLRERTAVIADGHHRYATYQALKDRHDRPGPWDYGLALLVDSDTYPPALGAIHRVIPGFTPDEAARRAGTAFKVVRFDQVEDGLAALAATEPDDTAYLLGGVGPAYLLTSPDLGQVAAAMPPERSDRWRGLDTARLHHLVIPRLWGIEDDSQVLMIQHKPEEAIAEARLLDGTAVILRPMRIADVAAIAAGGEKVPRKSTAFGPKPRTGLIMRSLRTA